MKTALDWIETLPSPYREAAIESVKAPCCCWLYGTLHMAIFSALRLGLARDVILERIDQGLFDAKGEARGELCTPELAGVYEDDLLEGDEECFDYVQTDSHLFEEQFQK